MADPEFCLNVVGGDGTKVKISAENSIPVGGKFPMLHAVGLHAVVAPLTIVAAPGVGSRIVVSSFTIQNESATATVMILREGGTDIERVDGPNEGDGLARAYPVGREWRLPEDTALNYVLDGANSCNYSIHYWIEGV
ncbi:MAG: hypothetical protein ACYTEQ_25110 [Planctomycetota bacterium]|jgi:hypothetical protein